MDISESSASEPRSEGATKAGILNRAVAKVIDFIIIGLLLKAIPQIGYFAGLAYLLIGDGLFKGKSVGKRIIGLSVVDDKSGKLCSFRESAIRNFIFAVAYILMFIPLIGFIGFIFSVVVLLFEGLLIIGSEKGMRLGDELARTMVIEENPAALSDSGT